MEDCEQYLQTFLLSYPLKRFLNICTPYVNVCKFTFTFFSMVIEMAAKDPIADMQ